MTNILFSNYIFLGLGKTRNVYTATTDDQTVFTISYVIDENVDVYINGVLIYGNYTLSGNDTLTLDYGVQVNDVITVIEITG